jgi:hypothetical protein
MQCLRRVKGLSLLIGHFKYPLTYLLTYFILQLSMWVVRWGFYGFLFVLFAKDVEVASWSNKLLWLCVSTNSTKRTLSIVA